METSRRKALGRGLEELFNNEPMDYEKIEEKIMDESTNEEIVELPLSELRSNPYQPRKNFDEGALQELANSIKEHGVFQPIIAKKSIKGYEIIAGERRVKASILAGKETIPAILRDFSDQDMMEIALLENLQRENLNALEEAIAYKKLIDELSLTQDKLAERLGKSRSHITNMLGLLSLPEEVKDMIMANKLSMSHARVLSKIEDSEKVKQLAEKIVVDGLSVREVEDLSHENIYEKKNSQVRHETNRNEYKVIEEELSDKFGTKVKIKNNKIEIHFVNPNDLNRILEIIGLDN
ncbi:MAG: ParB/RepB/Spo0J family partition protein [Tenericutes bacterium]|nr:ParB/RepB/Spo0J family partition protein [Mycoplasmatota bacterium]